MKRILAFFSLVAMAIGFLLWFKDWKLSAIVLAAIVLHEIGHAFVIWFHGVKTNMFFVPFLGATVYYSEQEAKKLNDLASALCALAGPAVNICLLITGLVAFIAGYEEKYAIAMMSINASLAFFNLMPIGIFDGGRFQKSIFKSLNERGDKKAKYYILVAAIAATLVLGVMGKFSLSYFLIVYFTRKNSEDDDPRAASGPKAMSANTAMSLVVLYIVMIFGTMIVSAFVPHWTDYFSVWPFS